MPRKAKLFTSSSGSAVRGFLKFRANIPPRWIRNARVSRKRIEPEIVRSLHRLVDLRKDRPRARVAMKNASKELRTLLKRCAREWKEPRGGVLQTKHYRSYRTTLSEWVLATLKRRRGSFTKTSYGETVLHVPQLALVRQTAYSFEWITLAG